MRLSANPSTHDYGALTLRIQLHHHVKYLRTVPATVFFPRPDVDSAVVRILPRDPQELPPHDEELLLKLIRLGFSQRRKQLRKLLRERVDDWDAIARASEHRSQRSSGRALVTSMDRPGEFHRAAAVSG